VLAFMTFPKAHWPQIDSTNPLEQLNADIKRRTHVVGIFPNDAAITWLVGAMMLEQNDGWVRNRRSMQLEGLESLCDTSPTRLWAVGCGTLSIVSLSLSGLWRYTTSRDTPPYPFQIQPRFPGRFCATSAQRVGGKKRGMLHTRFESVMPEDCRCKSSSAYPPCRNPFQALRAAP